MKSLSSIYRVLRTRVFMPNGTQKLTAADCFRVGKSYGLLLSPCPLSASSHHLASSPSLLPSRALHIPPANPSLHSKLSQNAIYSVRPSLTLTHLTSRFQNSSMVCFFSVPHLAFFIHSLTIFMISRIV